MRNFMIHEYFGVSDRILWDTIQIDLPPLEGHLRNIS
ncbi:MAG: HepT-like ribonuclease domain-containing protein [Syntrophobacteraceae bacterium]